MEDWRQSKAVHNPSLSLVTRSPSHALRHGQIGNSYQWHVGAIGGWTAREECQCDLCSALRRRGLWLGHDSHLLYAHLLVVVGIAVSYCKYHEAEFPRTGTWYLSEVTSTNPDKNLVIFWSWLQFFRSELAILIRYDFRNCRSSSTYRSRHPGCN